MDIVTGLRKVRDELKKHYVPLINDERKKYERRNYSGTGQGCCVVGATLRVGDFALLGIINTTAQELFPQLKGAKRPRLLAVPKSVPKEKIESFDRNNEDYFNDNPALYVNNHLGKDAIPSVVRKAIDRERRKVKKVK